MASLNKFDIEKYTMITAEEVVKFSNLPTLNSEYKRIALQMIANDSDHQLKFNDLSRNMNITSLSKWEEYITSLTMMAESLPFAKKAIISKVDANNLPEIGERIIQINIKKLGSIMTLSILREIFNKYKAYVEEFILHGFIWHYDGETYCFKYTM